MKTKTALATIMVSSSLLLSGCATTGMQDMVGQINGSLSELGKALSIPGTEQSGAATSSSTGLNGTSFKETKLIGIYNRSISPDGRAPEWPKVAITNLKLPSEMASATRRPKRNDCILFDAVLWYDGKNKETFKDISLCAQDLPKRSNGFVTVWRTFPINGKTSGQVRSDGPTPPYSKLPSDAVTDRWMSGSGMYFIGSMLTMMGYDPQFSVDNRRFWVRDLREI